MDWIALTADRLRCRLTRYHGPGCRGRTDHCGPGGVVDPDRWVSHWTPRAVRLAWYRATWRLTGRS